MERETDRQTDRHQRSSRCLGFPGARAPDTWMENPLRDPNCSYHLTAAAQEALRKGCFAASRRLPGRQVKQPLLLHATVLGGWLFRNR